MAITDVFSKRGQPLPDVFVYDDLPKALRSQIVNILEDTLGTGPTVWSQISKKIAHEHGFRDLPTTKRTRAGYSPAESCFEYIGTAAVPHALDLVELAFNEIYQLYQCNPNDPAPAIYELNGRFREHGVGYQFENGQLIRVDSKLIHAEAVKPALALLSEPEFAGPNREFLLAYEHFRHARIEDAVTSACKAFESTMKAICAAQKCEPRDYENAQAGALIKMLLDRDLVPRWSEEQLRNVEKCLLGLSTLRNKSAAHGGGATPRDVPAHYAAYALHLAASNIVFLVESHHARSSEEENAG